jgi:hypothetical protein
MRGHRWLLVPMLLASVRALPAQENKFMSITTLELSAPLGDTRNYVKSTAGPGLTWEGRWKMRQSAAAGVQLTVSQFSEHTDDTMTFPSGAVTGDMLRHLVTGQVLGTAYWYPVKREKVRWYAGGGLGGGHADQDFDLGTHRVSRSAWHMLIAPEVGAEIRRRDSLFVGVVSLRYNAPISSGNYLGGGKRSFQYLTLRIGLGEE